MRYKIAKNRTLFRNLVELHKEMKRCDRAAFKVCKDLGYKKYTRKFHSVAGGISSFVLPAGPVVKPDGWRWVFGKASVFPSKLKKNADLLACIAALPFVHYEDLNKLFEYDWRKQRVNLTGKFSMHPEVSWHKDYILVAVSDNMVYEPVADMKEILYSEYETLKAKK